jgi:hypothetical protein
MGQNVYWFAAHQLNRVFKVHHNDTQHNGLICDTLHKRHSALTVSSAVMLSVNVLNVTFFIVVLIVIMLSVVMQSVVMLSVAAPYYKPMDYLVNPTEFNSPVPM